MATARVRDDVVGGSPPRARGHVSRIPCWNGGNSVHPRVRGDMMKVTPNTRPLPGSPPRARGHGDIMRRGKHESRFTPACAGTCYYFLLSHCGFPVHPRVRGDMLAVTFGGRLAAGSPPRARGHDRPREPWRIESRFTPACAGTCCRVSPPRSPLTVHPRVRGDMAAMPTAIDRATRFTPACAGT